MEQIYINIYINIYELILFLRIYVITLSLFSGYSKNFLLYNNKCAYHKKNAEMKGGLIIPC